MLKKKLQISLIAGILAIAILTNSTVTYAAGPLETLKSGTEEVVLNGITYNHYSEVNRFDNGVNAKTYIGTANGQYVPAHTLGLRTGLYNSSGQMIRQTAWAENSYRAIGMSALSSVHNKTGIYYAMGDVKILEGDKWRNFATLQTGTLSFTSPDSINISQDLISIEFDGYKINDNNKTYGSGFGKLIYGEAPDLVSVVGLNGRSGYVYQDELNVGMISSPADTSLYLETNYPIRIPVYMEDGTTLIDYFEVEEGEFHVY